MIKRISTLILLFVPLLVISGCAVNVNVETRDTVYVTENDAMVNGYISEYEEMPTTVGIYFGTSEDNMKKIVTDKYPNGKMKSVDIDVKYDITIDGGKVLTPDTTYYYKFYARFGDKEATGEVKSFTTAHESAAAEGVTVETSDATEITDSDARLNGVVTSDIKTDEAGVYFGMNADNLKKVAQMKDPYAEYNLTKYNVWFYALADAGYDLTADTTYYYQFYARVGNNETRGEIKSFTTAPEQQ